MAVLLTVPLMVMVSEISELLVKAFLVRTGLPDLNDKWLAIFVWFKFLNETYTNKYNVK
jgi:hypothetical protein